LGEARGNGVWFASENGVEFARSLTYPEATGHGGKGLLASCGEGQEGDRDTFAEIVQIIVEGDLALVEKDDATAEALDVSHVVGGEENGTAFAVQELDGGFQKLAASGGVQPPGGFIQDEEFGAVTESAEQGNLPGLAFC